MVSLEIPFLALKGRQFSYRRKKNEDFCRMAIVFTLTASARLLGTVELEWASVLAKSCPQLTSFGRIGRIYDRLARSRFRAGFIGHDNSTR